MELDDMKQMWQQQDKALQQNNMLNEKLLDHLLNQKSKSAIGRMLNIEYISAAVAGLVLLFLCINPAAASAGLLLSICYFTSLGFILAALLFGAYKIKHLNSINPAADTVTQTAEKMQRFRLMIVMERSIGLLAMPILIVAMFAVMMQYIHQVDIFENILPSLPRLVLGFVAAIIAILFMYRRLYFHNIRQVMDNLKEITDFKKG